MDEKINLKAIDRYAEAYALKLSDHFFQKKEKISGKEILTVSEVKQVNLFIIRDLMVSWKLQAEKAKSPYFDYQNKEVAEAMINYQNVLSNHILVAKKDFIPLLKKAVANTLYLILDPYDFYAEMLDKEEGLLAEDLKADLRYIKFNQAPLAKLLDTLMEKELHRVSGNEAFAMLDKILEEVNFTPEEPYPFVGEFSKVEGLKIEDLFQENVKTPVVEKKQPPRPPTKESPGSEAGTLAEDLARQKVFRMKDNLTINQKFMFTKILFHGDFEIFTEAIDKLDRFDNLDQAMKYINDAYPEWDRESEEYEEFLDVLKKRFS